MTAGWLIVGASGHARSLAAVIRARGERVAAVCDRSLLGLSGDEAGELPGFAPFMGADGVPVLFADDGDAIAYAQRWDLRITIGIGNNTIRSRIADVLDSTGAGSLCTPLIASSASVDDTAKLGPLSQVLEHAHVGPLARIGRAVVVNTAAVVEHEATVGNGSHLAPGSILLGGVTIGSNTFIGSGARVLPGITVGSGAVLGAGAVATRRLAENTVYVGVPATALASKRGSTN